MTGRTRGAPLPDWLTDRLARARTSLGLSYRQVGTAAGVPHGHVWLIEHGRRRPSTVVARRLADVLELDDATTAVLVEASADDAGQAKGQGDDDG